MDRAFEAFAGQFLRRVNAEFAADGDFAGGVIEHVGRLDCGCVSMTNSNGQTIFVADAHRDDGRRFIVHADDKLSAFVELEREGLGRGQSQVLTPRAG